MFNTNILNLVLIGINIILRALSLLSHSKFPKILRNEYWLSHPSHKRAESLIQNFTLGGDRGGI